MSWLVLGSFFGPIAADIAAAAPDGARVLEVGCGPGHLSIRLARQHGLDVTGLDLDPAMIERARANADRSEDGDERWPSFLVGDVAALPFPTNHSTWSSARCRCTTGPTRRRAWPRSTACCVRAPVRSSGTSGPAFSRSTVICPIRSSTRMALRFAWWARPRGSGPGDSTSHSGSS
jgi:SAM-dependent methyltransferase